MNSCSILEPVLQERNQQPGIGARKQAKLSPLAAASSSTEFKLIFLQ